ncbi:MAG: hypothetical protein AAB732_01730 [Patescibacteria group bacterium]
MLYQRSMALVRQAQRWKIATSIEDKSSRPHKFNSTLISAIFEMKEKTIDFVNKYNFKKRLKFLNYKTPEQYLKDNKNIILQHIVS